MNIGGRPVAVVGLGKLGLPLAACFAAKGFPVIAMDVDSEKVEALNKGIPQVYERGLHDLLQGCQRRLRATTDIEDAVMSSWATFIVVPTPSDGHGGFSVDYVVEACKHVGDALRRKRDFHLVVLISTVLPGSSQGHVKPMLEACSGKQCGTEFGFCYSPAFVALGSVIRDFLNPNFILIGESDPRSGKLLASLYKKVCENSPPIARMNLVNAELTKLAVNTYVTTKITFANMIARLCEYLPDANVDTVTSALGLDGRIGGKYLKGAVGYGGPCFPRDNLALAYLARQLGVAANLAEVTDAANREGISQLVECVNSKLPRLACKRRNSNPMACR